MAQPQLIIGLYTEGSTDVRFLTSIVERTFNYICCKECRGELDILGVQGIEITKSTFSEDIINASRKGNDFGIMILCIHTDADNRTDTNAYQNKIIPALNALENCNEDICKNIVSIVPIQMTESWMLADKDLFKKVIGGTNKSDNELEIYKAPEEYADPKEVIKTAIRIANQERPRRHRKDLSISDLYLQIGQSISISKLETVPSYAKFQDNIREALKRMNYLY